MKKMFRLGNKSVRYFEQMQRNTELVVNRLFEHNRKNSIYMCRERKWLWSGSNRTLM